MRVNNFFICLVLRLLFIDLHFFIATIQIGIIVQVLCYTPLLSNFRACSARGQVVALGLYRVCKKKFETHKILAFRSPF